MFAGGTAVGVDRHGGWRWLLDAASLGPRQGITSATAPGCPTVAAAGRPDARGRTRPGTAARPGARARRGKDRKSVVLGKSVSVRVDLGGRRIIKQTNKAKKGITLRH